MREVTPAEYVSIVQSGKLTVAVRMPIFETLPADEVWFDRWVYIRSREHGVYFQTSANCLAEVY